MSAWQPDAQPALCARATLLRNNPKIEVLQREVPDVKVLTGDLTDLSSLIRAFDSAQPTRFAGEIVARLDAIA